jgi:hypothetical protein
LANTVPDIPILLYNRRSEGSDSSKTRILLENVIFDKRKETNERYYITHIKVHRDAYDDPHACDDHLFG